jgi:hypothetical protein
MSVRQILALKTASVQMRIDAVTAQEAALIAQITRLRGQADAFNDENGSGPVSADLFAAAAQSMLQARTLAAKLDRQRAQLAEQRQALAREKLSLDVADQKLAEEERKAARLKAARAAP